MTTKTAPTGKLAEILGNIEKHEIQEIESRAKSLLQHPNWVYRQENIATSFSPEYGRRSDETSVRS